MSRKRRRAEQHAEERRHHRRERQREPERQREVHACRQPVGRQVLHEAEPLERLPEAAPLRLHLEGGEDAVGIGADREERGIAEVEQAGEADDDVQAERQRGDRPRRWPCCRCRRRCGAISGKAMAASTRKQQHARCASRCAPDMLPERSAGRCGSARGVRSVMGVAAQDLVGRDAPEQAGRLEHQHQHQDREDDHVGPGAWR